MGLRANGRGFRSVLGTEVRSIADRKGPDEKVSKPRVAHKRANEEWLRRNSDRTTEPR